MAQARRIKVKGVRKQEFSPDDIERISMVLWLQAKRILREKRAREEKAKAARRARERRQEDPR